MLTVAASYEQLAFIARQREGQPPAESK